ncbi:hypothetical protein [Actinophytocola oryzae]|uniref:ATP-grasp domain-containing protein n=1 Tax=Actinophytocola oryzae TaxID=502181 RepID=A0A4R7UQU8_9PSEU|nr:hypothetical protein [Actinophytocola oryzae]TDV36828.1 hypothetical protein CLV71_13034 [Actinophytocola oryzae]
MIDKIAAVGLVRRFGLECLPAEVLPPGLAEDERARRMAAVAGDRTLVVRAAADVEVRNLPRAVGLTVDDAAAWARRLDPGLSVVVQPYAPLLFSAEILLAESAVVCEYLPGIWELDTPITPAVLVLASGGHRVVSAPLRPQPARFHSLGAGRVTVPSLLGDWPVAELAGWAVEHADGLRGLRDHLGVDVILKCHYADGFGVSPQNIRTSTGLDLAALETDEPAPPGLPVLETPDADLAGVGDAVLVRVTVPRESARELDRFAARLAVAGVRHVYVESGLLSHLAIALREAGLAVHAA